MMRRRIATLLTLALFAVACATAGGALIGAGIGAIAGDAGLGAAVGATAGAVVDIFGR
jgi:hypothetical protein